MDLLLFNPLAVLINIHNFPVIINYCQRYTAQTLVWLQAVLLSKYTSTRVCVHTYPSAHTHV